MKYLDVLVCKFGAVDQVKRKRLGRVESTDSQNPNNSFVEVTFLAVG